MDIYLLQKVNKEEEEDNNDDDDGEEKRKYEAKYKLEKRIWGRKRFEMLDM